MRKKFRRQNWYKVVGRNSYSEYDIYLYKSFERDHLGSGNMFFTFDKEKGTLTVDVEDDSIELCGEVIVTFGIIQPGHVRILYERRDGYAKVSYKQLNPLIEDPRLRLLLEYGFYSAPDTRFFNKCEFARSVDTMKFMYRRRSDLPEPVKIFSSDNEMVKLAVIDHCELDVIWYDRRWYMDEKANIEDVKNAISKASHYIEKRVSLESIFKEDAAPYINY